MNETTIDVRELWFRYGGADVLRDISFQVPSGCVCGLVGENGVGKTTLIKHLLGRLRPRRGTVSVFGSDPAEDPVGVLGRIGYLSEDRDMPNWMRVGEFIQYMKAFYPSWDDRYADELTEMFALDRDARIDKLSRGQRARTGLLVALAHRPPLLLLDEPSSGLDAVVRRDILNAVIRVAADEGRTVLFSSHLLYELQRVSDRIIMIENGTVRLEGTIDQLIGSHVQFTLSMRNGDQPSWHDVDVVSQQRDGNDWQLIVHSDDASRIHHHAGSLQAEIIRQAPPTLEELFVAVVGRTEHGDGDEST